VLHAAVDVVPDGTHDLERLPGRVVQFPVEVALRMSRVSWNFGGDPV
jgi:hypothetical protein